MSRMTFGRRGLALVVSLAGLRALAVTLTPDMALVVPDDDRTGVSAAIGEAARELAKNVAEAAGFRPRVVAASKHAGGPAVWFGADAAKRAGLSTEGLRLFDNVIATRGGDVYLYGLDRPGHRAAKPLPWTGCVLPTVRAAARFMEKFMGVRYVAPGETGCEVRKVARIDVPEGLVDREKARMSFDCGRYFTMMYSMANGLFACGSFRAYGGHIYPSAFPYKALFDAHPEYFGLVGDDRAQSQAHNPVICISNPEVKRRLVAHIAADFDAGYDIVELGQNDGMEHCQCSACAAYGGTSSVSEKFWLFHRAVAEELNRTHPDKTVMIINYGLTQTPPQTFTEFPPNVMVELMNSTAAAFEVWKNYKVARGFSVYTYLWGEYPMPGFTAKESYPSLIETARRFASRGVRGVYRCGYGELFGTEGPGYYLFNRLLQDPEARPEALLQDYYDAAYGPASGAMRSFHETLDRRLRGVNRIQAGFPAPAGKISGISARPQNALDIIAYIYTPATCASLEGFLARAESAATLTERQRRRLALVRTEFDYAKELGRIAALYGAFRFNPTKAFFDPLADAILARNARIDALYDAKGRMRPVPGWPELRLFGGLGKGLLQHNGRLGATLNAPVTWDVALMREKGVIPGGPAKSTVARTTLAASPWNEVGGMQLDRLDFATRFRVAHDAENLYVEVEAELPDGQTFEAQGHDGVCFRQECLELFVDPTGRREKSYHFIWNPVANSFYEAAYGLCADPLDPRFDQFNVDWNGKWSYTTSRANGVWRSVVTVPFASLGVVRPERGERWLLNVGRETFRPGDQQIGLWNPSLEGRGMRDLEAMGSVVFED